MVHSRPMGPLFAAMLVVLQVVPHGYSHVKPAERSFTPLTPLASTYDSESSYSVKLIAREGVCALHCEQGYCTSERDVCCWGLSGCCPSGTTCTVDGCCPIGQTCRNNATNAIIVDPAISPADTTSLSVTVTSSTPNNDSRTHSSSGTSDHAPSTASSSSPTSVSYNSQPRHTARSIKIAFPAAVLLSVSLGLLCWWQRCRLLQGCRRRRDHDGLPRPLIHMQILPGQLLQPQSPSVEEKARYLGVEKSVDAVGDARIQISTDHAYTRSSGSIATTSTPTSSDDSQDESDMAALRAAMRRVGFSASVLVSSLNRINPAPPVAAAGWESRSDAGASEVLPTYGHDGGS
ncbi:hypothetical protein EXIGLDRAFT_727542 [Exidia glandulosa HHB12029]|uniref:Granulins domain-containing protein n=1 Tax=Exidia glandulosa HHB12029 TaxID=1314781 RepID=A0A165DC07_EXIGL|nr:hypothetical protein EXIGLDRAFT_727542 [Exidia glandulosa HHB12029]